MYSVYVGRGELQVCRVSEELIVGRGKLHIRVLKELIRVDSDRIVRQCMCKCGKRRAASL